MGSTEKRSEIWDSMLDAEMNEFYWTDEAQRHGSIDRLLKTAIAILSSSTTLALFALFSSHPGIGKSLALLATTVSLVHSISFSTSRLRLVTGLAARWKEVAIEYRLLWARLEDDDEIATEAWKEFEVIRRREKQIDESAFRINQGRLARAQERVKVRRRLHE